MELINTPWGTTEQVYNITRAGKHIWAETKYGGGVGIKNYKKCVSGVPGVIEKGEYTWFGGKTAWALAALYSPGVIDLLCGVFHLPAARLHRAAMKICSRHYPVWMIKSGYLPLSEELEQWLASTELTKQDAQDIILVRNYLKEAS